MPVYKINKGTKDGRCYFFRTLYTTNNWFKNKHLILLDLNSPKYNITFSTHYKTNDFKYFFLSNDYIQ